ncbi:MAG: flavodoxin family protein [Desulfobacterota bacterium]|nr:flavodoxin family protein [Thermodesulfobacteriota bacterium]
MNRKYPWADDSEEVLIKLCAFFPEVIRERWVERIVLTAERIAAYNSRERVDQDVFWQAVSEVFPGGYDPLVLQIKDMDRLRAEMAAARAQEDLAPGSEPVQMVQWRHALEIPARVDSQARVLAVTTSPRKGGNTDVIIDELLRACADSGCTTEKIYAADLDLQPCTGCRACRKGDLPTICTIRDEMSAVVYDKLFAADGFIIGFPIYTARENGIMANFMDRWDCLLNPMLTRKMPAGKKAVVVCSWMWPNPHAYDHVIEQIVILLKLHGIETVDVLAISGTRGKRHGRGVVKNHPDILKAAYRAGASFVQELG